MHKLCMLLNCHDGLLASIPVSFQAFVQHTQQQSAPHTTDAEGRPVPWGGPVVRLLGGVVLQLTDLWDNNIRKVPALVPAVVRSS
jgi:hypothetical protein